jgi:hypothetical protein
MIRAMTAGKPIWTTSSFLLYAGGLTVLGSAVAALAYLAASYGDAGYAAWSLLVLAVLYGVAHAFKRRGRWIAAGIFAFASVIAWGAFVASLWSWFGWLHASRSFSDFSLARLSLELLVLASALDDRRRFAFPFISVISLVVGWFFVVDLLTAGGSWTAAVTLVVGLAYLLAGVASSSPSAFWQQLVSGVLVGGALLYWLHTSDLDWALISVAALVYVAIAYATARSSWAVLGAAALLAAGTHFANEWARTSLVSLGGLERAPSPRLWVPAAVFAFVGFLLVALGLRDARERA